MIKAIVKDTFFLSQKAEEATKHAMERKSQRITPTGRTWSITVTRAAGSRRPGKRPRPIYDSISGMHRSLA